MAFDKKIYNPEKYEFSETPFNLLMQSRIHRILIICSNYDFYMLEEDGRIDEQIFNEYVSLNLRYPPVFLQASNAAETAEILKNDRIDLVIEMLNIEDIDAFALAKKIKTKYPRVPIVVLTHFSREVSIRLANEDLSAIDYVFCWLGNANLLLAIIKLLEDKMNVQHDVEKIGVQVILLVEDSIRYISTYLPNLYRIVLKQAREFIKEALNEHQRMMRMRGRPKILLAKNYEEAEAIYKKYKDHLLGIISDVSFKHNGVKEPTAGLKLLEMVRQDDKHMPFLIQSSNVDYRKNADELGAGFIHKYSKNLSIELRNYIIQNFGFGDFVFRDPITYEEIGRASDLQTLRQLIISIPDSSLEYHTSRDHVSKWLNARALFPIARMFKQLKTPDFDNLNEVRTYISTAISNFLVSKGRGVIAQFDRCSFNEYLIFSRIGEGSIGGKARGLAFINNIIKKYRIYNKYNGILISIPQTVVLSTDLFDEFMEMNNLYHFVQNTLEDEEILSQFIKSKLQDHLLEDLYAYVSVVRNPIAVRSSSKLEDSLFQPFAGIYSTYMIPNEVDNQALTVTLLGNAIKSVYASVFYTSSKAYINATSNLIDEEKMGIILQEVCGTRHDGLFYPTFSGVARSINFYPIEPEKPGEGVVNIAIGLGKYIVDGGISLRFSPKYPKKILQLSSPDMALKETQKSFFALDLNPDSFVPSTDECINLIKLKISEANAQTLIQSTSTYDFENQTIRDGLGLLGMKIVTFSNVLNYQSFPLADILQELLTIGQKEMNSPIEIEFAVNLDVPDGQPKEFSFLQIRPIVEMEQRMKVSIDKVLDEETIITSQSAMGNGTIENIKDFVYVKIESFNPSNNKAISLEIEKLNKSFIASDRNYVLVGPGRWGSRDPWLGIPVNWPQICNARLIVESGLHNFRIDPSQGTHFFQNLTSFRVGYFTINPFINDGFYDISYLNSLPAVYEDQYIRHIQFEQPLKIMIDGRIKKGVIMKP
jgi:CheY-like chemotaxis protein